MLYLVLLLPTVGRYGITWDEQGDTGIANNYIFKKGGWLVDSCIDPSQARLPMYFVAIIFFLLKNSSLILARLVSCFMGALTIIAVYIFCKQQYDYKKGLLACFLLATSPFFLSFARIAYTESDIFVTCAISWSFVCVSKLQEKRTVGWATITAIVLGLSLSSKFSAIAILPSVFLVLVMCPKTISTVKTYISKTDIVIIGIFLFTLLVSIFGVWGLLYLSTAMTYTLQVKFVHYLLVSFIWVCTVARLTFYHRLVMKPFILAFFVLAFSCLTSMLIPPVHMTSPCILRSFIGRALYQSNLNFLFMLEASILHFGCVLFKQGLAIGIWLWLSLLVTIIQFKNRKETRLLVLIFIFYFFFLIKLPLAQTFYMMPLLPILAIFGSDQFFRLYTKKRTYAIVLISISICSLITDMFLCYPDYNLNGKQWLGTRYLGGRSTIGYRSIVQTTSDGIEQVLKWSNDNIQPGELVVTYIYPEHIIRTICQNPKFQIKNGLWKKNPKFQINDGLWRSNTTFMNADYVITSINTEIEQGFGIHNPTGDVYKHPYDVKLLKANFTKVFTVKRAFDIEVASVWRSNVVQDGGK